MHPRISLSLLPLIFFIQPSSFILNNQDAVVNRTFSASFLVFEHRAMRSIHPSIHLFQMPCRRITSRDVASMTQPGFNLADLITFSPDDRLITYLRSPNHSLMRQLYAYDLATDREYLYAQPEEIEGSNQDNLSKEEKLRREVGVFFACLRSFRCSVASKNGTNEFVFFSF